MVGNVDYPPVITVFGGSVAGSVVGTYHICVLALVDLDVDAEFTSKCLDLEVVAKDARPLHALQALLEGPVNVGRGMGRQVRSGACARRRSPSRRSADGGHVDEDLEIGRVRAEVCTSLSTVDSDKKRRKQENGFPHTFYHSLSKLLVTILVAVQLDLFVKKLI